MDEQHLLCCERVALGGRADLLRVSGALRLELGRCGPRIGPQRLLAPSETWPESSKTAGRHLPEFAMSHLLVARSEPLGVFRYRRHSRESREVMDRALHMLRDLDEDRR